jgi:hypothetical protein
MSEKILNYDIQPLDAILTELQIKHQDLVSISQEPLTHKNVNNARKGRRMTAKMKLRITNTLNHWLKKQPATVDTQVKEYKVRELFNY